MSYILEALRRADEERERERGGVPSIHSQPTTSGGDEARPPRQPRLLLGVIAALLLVLVALLAWHLMRDESPRAVAVAPVEPVPTAPPVQAVPPPVEQTPAVQTAPPPPQAMQQPPPPVVAAPIEPVAPVAPIAPVRPPLQPRATPPAPTPMPSPPPTAVPSADTRIYSASELPEDVRRDLPKLVIGGAMYSDNPGNRMLIINSQIFHEGDKLTPDLLLQEIKLKSAVLKYKNYRYAVNY